MEIIVALAIICATHVSLSYKLRPFLRSDLKADSSESSTKYIPACLSLATIGPSSSTGGWSVISSVVASSSRSSSMKIGRADSQDSSTLGYSSATNLPLYPACLASLTTSRSSVMYSSSGVLDAYSISQSRTPVSSMATVTYMTNISFTPSKVDNYSKINNGDVGTNTSASVSMKTDNASPIHASNISSTTLKTMDSAQPGSENVTRSNRNSNSTTDYVLIGSTLSNNTIALITTFSQMSRNPNTVSMIRENANTFISRSNMPTTHESGRVISVPEKSLNITKSMEDNPDTVNNYISVDYKSQTASFPVDDSNDPTMASGLKMNYQKYTTSQLILATTTDGISGTFATESTGGNSASSEVPGRGNENDLNESDTDEMTATIDSDLTSPLTLETNMDEEFGTSAARPSTDSTSYEVLTSAIEKNSDGLDDSSLTVMSSTVDPGITHDKKASTTFAAGSTFPSSNDLPAVNNSMKTMVTTTNVNAQSVKSTESMDGGTAKSSDSLGSSTVSTTSGQSQNVALPSSFADTTVFHASTAADITTDDGKETAHDDEDSSAMASTSSSSGVKDPVLPATNQNKSFTCKKHRVKNC